MGLAVLVRACALSGVLTVGGGLLMARTVRADSALTEAGLAALMALPFLLLIPRQLLGPVGLDFRRAFGLAPASGGGGATFLVLAMLLAAGVAVDFGLTLLGDWRGWSAHWTEWFDASLAWGGLGTCWAACSAWCCWHRSSKSLYFGDFSSGHYGGA